MKRMLLVSMFQNVGDILKTIEPNLKNKTVTFIPTASLAEKVGFFVKIGKWRLKRMGLKVEELEISSSSYETIKSKLEKNDIIYIRRQHLFPSSGIKKNRRRQTAHQGNKQWKAIHRRIRRRDRSGS